METRRGAGWTIAFTLFSTFVALIWKSEWNAIAWFVLLALVPAALAWADWPTLRSWKRNRLSQPPRRLRPIPPSSPRREDSEAPTKSVLRT